MRRRRCLLYCLCYRPAADGHIRAHYDDGYAVGDFIINGGHIVNDCFVAYVYLACVGARGGALRNKECIFNKRVVVPWNVARNVREVQPYCRPGLRYAYVVCRTVHRVYQRQVCICRDTLFCFQKFVEYLLHVKNKAAAGFHVDIKGYANVIPRRRYGEVFRVVPLFFGRYVHPHCRRVHGRDCKIVFAELPHRDVIADGVQDDATEVCLAGVPEGYLYLDSLVRDEINRPDLWVRHKLRPFQDPYLHGGQRRVLYVIYHAGRNHIIPGNPVGGPVDGERIICRYQCRCSVYLLRTDQHKRRDVHRNIARVVEGYREYCRLVPYYPPGICKVCYLAECLDVEHIGL